MDACLLCLTLKPYSWRSFSDPKPPFFDLHPFLTFYPLPLPPPPRPPYLSLLLSQTSPKAPFFNIRPTRHHHSNPSLYPSPPPLNFSIPSLTTTFSQLASTTPSGALTLELIRRVSSLRHGHPFHQTITFFNWCLSFSPPPATLTDLFTVMIDLSAKLHCFPFAHKLLDKMAPLNVPVLSHTIITLIHWYIRASMLGLSKKLVTATYNLLIELFNKEDKMDMVLRIKKEMENNGVKSNVNTYSALITAYCGRGNWMRACDALMEMVEVKCLKPKDLVYRMVMDLLKRAGQLQKCKDLKEMMVKRGFLEKLTENAML
ncbi:uncharacterized protein LOC144567634 [Carex rostrata]